MTTPARISKTLAYLHGHGSAQLPHMQTTLLAHLQGTCELLSHWKAAPEVCLAGLCHAIYGTEGLPAQLEDPQHGAALAEVIGSDAEQLVYFYASCDRRWLYGQVVPGAVVGVQEPAHRTLGLPLETRQIQGDISFRDRFTGQVFIPPQHLYAAFLELTFANELEIIRRQPPEVSAGNRGVWEPLFEAWSPLVSKGAAQAARATFAHCRRAA